MTESIDEIDFKLNKISSIGYVHTKCLTCIGNMIGASEVIQIKFLSTLGDVPAISISDSSVLVTEFKKGQTQRVVGQSTYSTVIETLSSLSPWYIRIFTYNRIGGGPPSDAWLFPLRTRVVSPTPPRNVILEKRTANSLNSSWNGPESDGGGSVKSYLIEYDISPTFNGHSLIQYSVLETDADASVEKISFAYPHHSDYDFRNRIILANSDIIHNGIIQEGTKLTIEKKKLFCVTIE